MNTVPPLQPLHFSGSIGSQSRGQPLQTVELQTGQILKAQVLDLQANDKTLLQIGDSRLTARTEVPLKAGQTLQLQVTSTTPQVQLKIVGETLSPLLGKSITLLGKPIDITSLFRGLQQPLPQTGTSPTASPPSGSAATGSSVSSPAPTLSATPGTDSITTQLTPFKGHSFKGTVVEVQDANRYVIESKGLQLPVQSRVPLQNGQQVSLQLTQATPVQLQATQDAQTGLTGALFTLQQPTTGSAVLLNILQGTGSIFEILSPQSQSTLRSFFSSQQSPESGKEAGATLKQLMDRLGLAYERQLSQGDQNKPAHTLKAALLEILHSLKGSEQTTKSASQLLTSLELFQFAQLQSETGQQFIFPIPLPFVEQGYLLVDQNEKNKGEDTSDDSAGRRFSLHLKMSDIGNIRVDMLSTSEGLFIRFHTDSESKAEFVKEFSDELRDAITDIPVLGLSFGAEAEDPANELLRHVLPEGSGVLNTKA